MRDKAIKVFIILISMIPYGYLAMFVDIRNRSIWGYIIIILTYIAIMGVAVIFNIMRIVLLENLMSFALSYYLILGEQSERWNCYFKPFSAEMLLIVLTLLLVTLQLLCYKIIRNK